MVEGVDVSLTPTSNTPDSCSKSASSRSYGRSGEKKTIGALRKSTKGGWTEEEDEKLVKAVKQFDGKNCKKIAEAFPGRTDVQCLHRWQKVLNPELVKGPWTKEEDGHIVDLVAQHGVKKWSLIAKSLPGRIGKQCRERWHNHLNPEIKKDAWTPQEEMLLIQAHQKYGNKWAEIAKFLPGRADNSIKNHWNCSLRKRLTFVSASDGFIPNAVYLKKDGLKLGLKEVDTLKQSIPELKLGLAEVDTSKQSIPELKLGLTEVDTLKQTIPEHIKHEISSTACLDQQNPFKVENFMELPHVEANSSGQSIQEYDNNSMNSTVSLDHQDSVKVDNCMQLQPLTVCASRYSGVNNHRVLEGRPKCVMPGVDDPIKSLNCSIERTPYLSSPTTSSCNNHSSELSCQGSSVLHEADSTYDNYSDLQKDPSVESNLLLSLSSPCLDRTPQTRVLKHSTFKFSDEVGVSDTGLVLRTPQTSESQKHKSSFDLSLQLNNDSLSCLAENTTDMDNNCTEKKESPVACSTPPCLSLGLSSNRISPLSILRSAARRYKNTPSILRKRSYRSPQFFTDSQEDDYEAARSNGSCQSSSGCELFKKSLDYEYLPQSDKTNGSGIGLVSSDKFLYSSHVRQRAKILRTGKSIEKRLDLEFDKHS